MTRYRLRSGPPVNTAVEKTTSRDDSSTSDDSSSSDDSTIDQTTNNMDTPTTEITNFLQEENENRFELWILTFFELH